MREPAKDVTDEQGSVMENRNPPIRCCQQAKSQGPKRPRRRSNLSAWCLKSDVWCLKSEAW